MANKKIISASILAADFAHLADDVNAVLAAGVEAIHFDVMDHHFVPNLSFGAVVCQALRQAGMSAPIDVHLMVENPEAYIEPFAKAGANILTFHPETVDDVVDVVGQIEQAGMQAGLAFNPDKEVVIEPALAARLSMILLMSVFPGFGGQAFIPHVLDKVRHMRHWLDQNNYSAHLAVDGGIKVDNIAQVAHAGADFFVVGSGLFAAENYLGRVRELHNAID